MDNALYGGVVFGLLAGILITFGFPKLKREDSARRTHLLVAAYMVSYIAMLIILSIALQSPGFTVGFALVGVVVTSLYTRILLSSRKRQRKPHDCPPPQFNEDHPSWQGWYKEWHKKL